MSDQDSDSDPDLESGHVLYVLGDRDDWETPRVLDGPFDANSREGIGETREAYVEARTETPPTFSDVFMALRAVGPEDPVDADPDDMVVTLGVPDWKKTARDVVSEAIDREDIDTDGLKDSLVVETLKRTDDRPDVEDVWSHVDQLLRGV